ncbi:MAG: hypothetical protein FH753_14130 [Firmicutes bacterium]|nr:hypothetical protein [Bacillota bacterium]
MIGLHEFLNTEKSNTKVKRHIELAIEKTINDSQNIEIQNFKDFEYYFTDRTEMLRFYDDDKYYEKYNIENNRKFKSINRDLLRDKVYKRVKEIVTGRKIEINMDESYSSIKSIQNNIKVSPKYKFKIFKAQLNKDFRHNQLL